MKSYGFSENFFRTKKSVYINNAQLFYVDNGILGEIRLNKKLKEIANSIEYLPGIHKGNSGYLNLSSKEFCEGFIHIDWVYFRRNDNEDELWIAPNSHFDFPILKFDNKKLLPSWEIIFIVNLVNSFLNRFIKSAENEEVQRVLGLLNTEYIVSLKWKRDFNNYTETVISFIENLDFKRCSCEWRSSNRECRIAEWTEAIKPERENKYLFEEIQKLTQEFSPYSGDGVGMPTNPLKWGVKEEQFSESQKRAVKNKILTKIFLHVNFTEQILHLLDRNNNSV